MKLEFKLALTGTMIMTAICMAVSYGSMLEVAMMHRIAVAELFPLVVDGTMALSMFIRVYFSKIGKPTKMPVLIMAFFTATSIIVNAVAAQDILEVYIYAIAPIGVFACTELSAMVVEKQPTERKSKPRRKIVPKSGHDIFSTVSIIWW